MIALPTLENRATFEQKTVRLLRVHAAQYRAVAAATLRMVARGALLASVQRFCVGVSLASCLVGVERSGGWLAAISLASRQRCSYTHHVNKGARGSSGAQQPPRDALDTSHA